MRAATRQATRFILTLAIRRTLLGGGRPGRVAARSPGAIDRAPSSLVRLVRVRSLARTATLGDRLTIPVVVVTLRLLIHLGMLLLVPLARLLTLLGVILRPRLRPLDPLLAPPLLVALALGALSHVFAVLAADLLTVPVSVLGVVSRVRVVPRLPLRGQPRSPLGLARPRVTHGDPG